VPPVGVSPRDRGFPGAPIGRPPVACEQDVAVAVQRENSVSRWSIRFRIRLPSLMKGGIRRPSVFEPEQTSAIFVVGDDGLASVDR